LNISIRDKFAAVLDAVLNLFATGLANLASHLAVSPGNLDEGWRVGMQGGFCCRSHKDKPFSYLKMRIITLPPEKEFPHACWREEISTITDAGKFPV
jgi:hypothetical protein